jgi:hypothetical protein
VKVELHHGQDTSVFLFEVSDIDSSIPRAARQISRSGVRSATEFEPLLQHSAPVERKTKWKVWKDSRSPIHLHRGRQRALREQEHALVQAKAEELEERLKEEWGNQ